jgi:cytidyltransferase-like protein
VSGGEALVLVALDDPRFVDVRFLEESARVGPVHVLMHSDEAAAAQNGAPPTFPLEERRYFAEAVRYVERVTTLYDASAPDSLPAHYAVSPGTWVVPASADTPEKRHFCARSGLDYMVIADPTTAVTSGVQVVPRVATPSPAKRVIATGCYDWLHSGHIRFFEEASELGDLYVTVGNDVSVKRFKGPDHPLHSEVERRYMVSSIRFVTEALVSTGDGWMDAIPEIERLEPDIWVVNEDGDRAEKREYCETHGIEFRVLSRLPKHGLPARQSTNLRGF